MSVMKCRRIRGSLRWQRRSWTAHGQRWAPI